MTTTASERITRALGIADLVNATNISYNDKVNSINESYKDLYNLILDSDDDYYVTEVVIPIIPAYLNPNSIGQYYEYNVPMPSDVMRLRYVDYTGMGNWEPMDKYPLSMKDYNPSVPMYRWRNGNLNIIGGSTQQLGSIRVGYYPEPQVISVPDSGIMVAQNLTSAQQLAVSYPVFTNVYSGGNINQANGSLGKVVYYNSTSIVSEDEDLGTTTVLYTGVGITQVKYYQGWIFYVQAGSIFKLRTDLNSVSIPTLVVTPAFTPTLINVIIPNAANLPGFFNPPFLIWASDGTTNSNIYDINGGVVSTTTGVAYRSFFIIDGIALATNAAGQLLKFTGTTFTTGTVIPYSLGLILSAYTDGVAIYCSVANTTQIHKLLLNTAQTAIASDYTIANNINPLVSWVVSNNRAAYQELDGTSMIISLAQDTTITYPNNIVPELLSYQCALDFIAKQHGDSSQVSTRFSSLFQRYKDSLRRDDYQVERIKNDYPTSNYNYFR